MRPSDAAVLILAAGRGERAGGVAKALLALGDGTTYLERIWASARAIGVERGAVVVGPPHAAAVRRQAERLALVVLENPQPSRGMASSVALAFAWAAQAQLAGALLWPCDHPVVHPATLAALFAALGAHQAAIPDVGGRGGHPALVARALFGALARCGDEPLGARSVLRAAATVRVPVDDAGCARDIDDQVSAHLLRAEGR